MPALYVISGADEGKRFELTTAVVGLGREASNLVKLHDTEASRRHAELQRNVAGDYNLVDLGSSNGTFLNGKQAKNELLKPGDEIRIGQSRLVYVAVGITSETRTEPSQKEVIGQQAHRVEMIPRSAEGVPSEIVKTVSDTAGSQLLSQPEAATNPWLKNALANLSVMYQATQAVSHILDNDQLLERIMDLIFDTIQADRGCIMLAGESGYEPRAVRTRGTSTTEKITVSRSIMDHVLKAQQGVLVSDVTSDSRFAPAQSVQRQGIREALCVPMKGRHETMGVIYLDVQTSLASTTKRAGDRLTEDHLMLAVAIAHQAALALEESRYYRAMVQAERLAAVGQTIAAISHHIKNILQGLRSGNDLLKLGLDEENKQLLQQGFKIVDKNQTRIYDLVMDMLSYSKEREPSLEETNVTVLVNDVLELVEVRAKDLGIHLEKKLDSTLSKIPLDAEGIHRALLNITSNAIDALDGREKPHLLVQTHRETQGQWMQIVVADNGPGVPEHLHNDIFKPFVSTKGSKGTGLGLAVSRKILREHGGDLILHSEPNQGARFVLRIPIPSSSDPATGSRLTIRKEDQLAGA